jgi:hypothetical protein
VTADTAETPRTPPPTFFTTVFWPFLLSRLFVALWVFIGHWQRPYLAKVIGGWEGVHNWWLNPWTTFDSQHFIAIATTGYTPHNSVFFPLFPALLRLAGSNPVLIALWGVMLSNVCLAAGLWFFYRLTRLDYDDAVARRAVWLLAFFPATAFFSAVYTESVFLLLIVATFYCVRLGRWAPAGLWAVLAALTRNSGALIAVALCVEYFRARGPQSTGRRGASLVALVAALLPLFALGAVLFYFKARFGGLAAIDSQAAYFRSPSLPWMPIYRDLADFFKGAPDPIAVVNVAATLGVFYLVARYWKRQPPSYSVLMIGIMLMHLSYGHTIHPYTLGALRYVMTTFPFVQLLALETAPLGANPLRLRLCAVIYLLICTIMSCMFGFKIFMS